MGVKKSQKIVNLKESLLVYIFEFPQNIIVKITANAAGIYNHFHKLKIFEKTKQLNTIQVQVKYCYHRQKELLKKILNLVIQIKKIEKI